MNARSSPGWAPCLMRSLGRFVLELEQLLTVFADHQCCGFGGRYVPEVGERTCVLRHRSRGGTGPRGGLSPSPGPRPPTRGCPGWSLQARISPARAAPCWPQRRLQAFLYSERVTDLNLHQLLKQKPNTALCICTVFYTLQNTVSGRGASYL